MKRVKVICPECCCIVPGEITTHLFQDNKSMNDPEYISVYYAYCEKCNYHITESEWDEITEEELS